LKEYIICFLSRYYQEIRSKGCSVILLSDWLHMHNIKLKGKQHETTTSFWCWLKSTFLSNTTKIMETQTQKTKQYDLDLIVLLTPRVSQLYDFDPVFWRLKHKNMMCNLFATVKNKSTIPSTVIIYGSIKSIHPNFSKSL